MPEDAYNGSIRISEKVIAIMAGAAALSTPGIAGMSTGKADGLVKRLSGKNMQTGVAVVMGQGEVALELHASVHYGHPIHKVCRQLQRHVCESVETMTGLTVTAVHVKVDNIVISAL
ncbi:Asp23/Gls24 family envelope stress response protein [Paenibacillus sp. y28]|uniref:Asp23/Gls24 family envelope stress response protein n=1 Tax=Paenibacillus sp. y28 TaxID=3129110 RepID=UPI00301777A9